MVEAFGPAAVRDTAAAILAGLDVPVGELAVAGTAPVFASPYPADVAAAAAVGATSLAVARLWQLRNGGPPGEPLDATVDIRHAALAFRSERYLRLDGAPGDVWADLSGDYAGADGWVKLHANYPAHRVAILTALGVPAERDRVAAAVAARSVIDVEEAVVAAGGAAAAMRTVAQWARHTQGRAVAGLPLIAMSRIGDSPAVPLSPADSPLGTVRVLDLTRVIAGPVAGRSLAGYGADVLRVGADQLALVPVLVVDTGFGKRFCHLDLRTDTGRATLRELVSQADVVLQAYRPGALARWGFGPAECAALRPGLVYVSICAWGQAGPWRSRRGFDSLVQLACGIAAEGAAAAGVARPVPLPAQTLDHATGWLAALAAVEGLSRRHSVGGSWHAELSLARTAGWLDSLGRVPAGLGAAEVDPGDLLSTMDSHYGRLEYVRPPGTAHGYRPRWATPPHPPGTDPPTWLVPPHARVSA